MSHEIKALIVDDELSGRENLKTLIESYCSEIKVVGTASSAVEAKNMIACLSPHVVFLDVNMPVLDGFDLLESLDSSSFMVVFVTAHEEYAIKAIKAKAIDYLLKPINIKELQQTVKRVVENYSNNTAHLPNLEKVIIPVSHGFKVIHADDVIRLEAEDCYTHLFTTKEKKITISKTLKEFEDKFSADHFVRVHKSHLINLMHIKDYTKLDGGCITMSDGVKIPVSRRKAEEFSDRCRVYNGNK
ncbi:MAG: response regulator [Ignavibacteria bacterium]|nr:response regulator [Ignavibacteria bacterium]